MLGNDFPCFAREELTVAHVMEQVPHGVLHGQAACPDEIQPALVRLNEILFGAHGVVQIELVIELELRKIACESDDDALVDVGCVDAGVDVEVSAGDLFEHGGERVGVCFEGGLCRDACDSPLAIRLGLGLKGHVFVVTLSDDNGDHRLAILRQGGRLARSVSIGRCDGDCDEGSHEAENEFRGVQQGATFQSETRALRDLNLQA